MRIGTVHIHAGVARHAVPKATEIGAAIGKTVAKIAEGEAPTLDHQDNGESQFVIIVSYQAMFGGTAESVTKT